MKTLNQVVVTSIDETLQKVEILAKQLHNLNWLENDSVECQTLLNLFADLCDDLLSNDNDDLCEYAYKQIQAISKKYSVYY